jgi:MFS family permease
MGLPLVMLLRQWNFALLWVGQLISTFGDWILFIALPVVVYNLTGSTLATGGMFITQTLPGLLFSSLAGVFVDRWDRKRTLILADMSRALLLLPLLAIHSSEGVWIVYPVAFVQSLISLFFVPAKDALIPHLVDQRQLMAANSLNALSGNIARLAGPALGGALLSLAGLTLVVLLDSISYLISGTMIALISLPRRQTGGPQLPATPDPMERASVWQDWLEGLNTVKRDARLTTIFIVNGIVMLAEGIINVLFVAFVKDVLQGNGLEFGWLMTARGLGALVGGFIVGYVGKSLTPMRITILGAVGIGVIYLAMFNTAALPLALPLFALSGVPGIAYGVGVQTSLQSGVADRYRGRMFGAFGTTNGLMLLAGAGLAGLLGDVLGVVPMLDGVAALYLVASLVAMRMLRDESSR